MIPKIALVLLSSFFLKTHDIKHDFYVSVTSIMHSTEKQNLSIRIKLLANDLEQTFLDKISVFFLTDLLTIWFTEGLRWFFIN